jgi:hypothetical protein
MSVTHYPTTLSSSYLQAESWPRGLPLDLLNIGNKMECAHDVSKQHARDPVWSFADPLHEPPLIFLALIVLLDGSQVTIVFFNTIAGIPTALVFVPLAEATDSDTASTVAHLQWLRYVKWKARREWRLERVSAWRAMTRWESKTSFYGACVTTRD